MSPSGRRALWFEVVTEDVLGCGQDIGNVDSEFRTFTKVAASIRPMIGLCITELVWTCRCPATGGVCAVE